MVYALPIFRMHYLKGAVFPKQFGPIIPSFAVVVTAPPEGRTDLARKCEEHGKEPSIPRIRDGIPTPIVGRVNANVHMRSPYVFRPSSLKLNVFSQSCEDREWGFLLVSRSGFQDELIALPVFI